MALPQEKLSPGSLTGLNLHQAGAMLTGIKKSMLLELMVAYDPNSESRRGPWVCHGLPGTVHYAHEDPIALTVLPTLPLHSIY